VRDRLGLIIIEVLIIKPLKCFKVITQLLCIISFSHHWINVSIYSVRCHVSSSASDWALPLFCKLLMPTQKRLEPCWLLQPSLTQFSDLLDQI